MEMEKQHQFHLLVYILISNKNRSKYFFQYTKHLLGFHVGGKVEIKNWKYHSTHIHKFSNVIT